MPPADPGGVEPHTPAADLGAVLGVLREVRDSLIAVDERAAARLVGVSEKLLSRASDAGQPTGRRKVGRRVVYLIDELTAWVRSLPAN